LCFVRSYGIREALIEAAKLGRVAGHSPEARARQAEKQRRHAVALKAWNPSDQPDWLTKKVYCKKIQPRLAGITVRSYHRPLVSLEYAALIRLVDACAACGMAGACTVSAFLWIEFERNGGAGPQKRTARPGI